MSLILPREVGLDAIIGFDDLRVFVSRDALDGLTTELTQALESGPLAEAVSGLRLLYGDL
ncbi:TPA: hypothetical protein UM208_004822 [Klebsiella pneumoniae]|nr:hypothetical protein [Klebsiella pneumoniae]